MPSARSLAEAQDAILQLTIRGADQQPLGTGTAFLIDADGLAITNHHVVAGGSSAVARLVRSPLQMPVELLHVIPDLDLALVRVELVPGRGARHVRIERAEQPLGTRVYALGFPEGVGFTLTAGVVSGYRRCDQLPWRLDGLRPASRWVQSDCAMNPGNSGGPLVNEDGVVVAVNTWRWEGADAFYFSLAAAHVRELLRTAPPEPITFEAVANATTSSGPSFGALPRLEIRPRVSGSRVIRRTLNVVRRIDCRRCDGSGRVVVRRQVGHTGGSGWRRRVFRNSNVSCGICDGHGLKDAEVVLRLLTYLARDLPRMREDSRSEQALENAETQLPDVVQRIVSAHDAAIREAAVELLGDEDTEAETPVALIATVVGAPHDGSDAWLVTVRGADLPVIVADPRVADAEEGQTVLVGGLLAGFVSGGEAYPRVPVVQGGFLVGR